MKTKQDEIQEEALNSWINNLFKGTLVLATGSGKSKIAVMAANYYHRLMNKKILYVVPTEKLRDKDVPDEFKKWNSEQLFKENIKCICYASLANEIEHFDFVIFDECHHLTDNNKDYLKRISPTWVLGLTATPPKDLEKIVIIKEYCPVIYEYSLDTAVIDGVVAPYKINVVLTELDSITKNIKAGNKKKPFMQTEKQHYEYLSKQVGRAMFATGPKAQDILKFAILKRMRFIYELPSKTKIAEKIIAEKIKGKRSLIFAGGIEQANALCKHRYHSKTNDNDYNDFISDKIKHLSCVRALNEGINVPNIECELITQIESNDLPLTQKIGRGVRFRPGHIAEIWIIICQNTQDETWWKKASEKFDQTKINYINYKNL
jgi:superfamily II DNA or RNA helicase